MAVTIPEAQALVIEFCRSYPVAAQLIYYIRDTTEELYGDRSKGLDDMRGGYITGPGLHPDRCDIPCGKVKDASDLITTLRHEIIGHFGLNTFTGDRKRALLESIGVVRSHAPETVKVFAFSGGGGMKLPYFMPNSVPCGTRRNLCCLNYGDYVSMSQQT